jgi:hypothetical protein
MLSVSKWSLTSPMKTNKKLVKKPKNNVPVSCGYKMGTFPCAKKIVRKSCYIF